MTSTTSAAKPKPPAHLSAASKKWWKSVVESWELDSHHVLLLTEAATSLDRANEARRKIDEEGMTVQGLHGPKPHPLLNVERDARLVFARLLKSLNLDDDDGNDRPGRGRK